MASAIVAPMLGTAVNQTAESTAHNTTLFVANALGKWKGGFLGERRIKGAVNRRAVLGETRSLKRKPYATSPILDYVTSNCLQYKSKVFILYGPSGVGKTTSCHAVMEKYASKGLAFTPGDLEGCYKDIMLKELGFDVNNPPNGWLGKLIDELEAPRGQSPAVLLLDDYMNFDPFNSFDKFLLTSIKTKIRGRNVVVVVLTKNRKSANKMISWNDMQSIVPAASMDQLSALAVEFHKFQQTNDPETFTLNWDAYLPMKWKTEGLKDAVLVDPEHVNKSLDERNNLKHRIDDIIENMAPDERCILGPGSLLSQLVDIDRVPTLPSPTKGTFEWVENGCGSDCTIL